MSAPKHTAHPLDGAFVTTESIGGADPAKRSATFKVAFVGEGCVERVHAAEDYIKALVAADRDAPNLLAIIRDLKIAFGDPMTRRALGGHNERQMAAILAASAAIAKATGADQ